MKNKYFVHFVPVSLDREAISLPFVATSYQVNKLAYVLSLVFRYSQYSSIGIYQVKGSDSERVAVLDFPNAKESV